MSLTQNNYKPAHIFLHLPRTGGSNLHNVLLGAGDRIHLFRENDVTTGPESAAEFYHRHRGDQKPIVLMGHHLIGVHRLIGTTPRYYTILREPVERDVSGYYFVRNPQYKHPYCHAANRLPLTSYLNQYVHPDTQTRTILGDRTPYLGPLSEGHVELARWTLKTLFAFVGRFDKYAESVAEILRLIGLPPRPIHTMESSTPTTLAGLSEDDRRELEGRNEYDRKLWQIFKTADLTSAPAQNG